MHFFQAQKWVHFLRSENIEKVIKMNRKRPRQGGDRVHMDQHDVWSNKQTEEEPYDFLFHLSSRPPSYDRPGRGVVKNLYQRPAKQVSQISGDSKL